MIPNIKYIFKFSLIWGTFSSNKIHPSLLSLIKMFWEKALGRVRFGLGHLSSFCNTSWPDFAAELNFSYVLTYGLSSRHLLRLCSRISFFFSRSDQMLEDIIFKLVPGLQESKELCKSVFFYIPQFLVSYCS